MAYKTQARNWILPNYCRIKLLPFLPVRRVYTWPISVVGSLRCSTIDMDMDFRVQAQNGFQIISAFVYCGFYVQIELAYSGVLTHEKPEETFIHGSDCISFCGFTYRYWNGLDSWWFHPNINTYTHRYKISKHYLNERLYISSLLLWFGVVFVWVFVCVAALVMNSNNVLM